MKGGGELPPTDCSTAGSIELPGDSVVPPHPAGGGLRAEGGREGGGGGGG